MVVLDAFGKIERTLISEKLKLYVANLPNNQENDWQASLEEELKTALLVDSIEAQKLSVPCRRNIKQLFESIFPNCDYNESLSNEMMIHILAENMVCLFFDYDYCDMPLGDWTENCFDGRFCEDDYAEKVIHFINFLSGTEYLMSNPPLVPAPVPNWIYSSNHDDDRKNYIRLLWGGGTAEPYIETLKKWGQAFDDFLISPNAYYQLDYLFESIYKDNEYNNYHFFKTYSLCEMLLGTENVEDKDRAISEFLVNQEESKRIHEACLLRQIRNKIGHGDFEAYRKKKEEYAQNFMDGAFWFDYTEYSRQNWITLHICCQMESVLRKLLLSTFLHISADAMS